MRVWASWKGPLEVHWHISPKFLSHLHVLNVYPLCIFLQPDKVGPAVHVNDLMMILIATGKTSVLPLMAVFVH